jgi:hypothetical protein
MLECQLEIFASKTRKSILSPLPLPHFICQSDEESLSVTPTEGKSAQHSQSSNPIVPMTIGQHCAMCGQVPLSFSMQ